ncbi:MAG: TA system VapC family ribonuclease toxin [Bryobacteraceae bacterium]
MVAANLLVYARVSSMPQHEAARRWLDERLNEPAQVGFPWPSLLGFLRIVTNPRIFERPESVHGAWKQVERWLSCPNVWIPQPTANHRRALAPLIAGLGGGGNLVPDAHMAALAIEHGLTLCSTDGDFGRFANLKWRNPLAE